MIKHCGPVRPSSIGDWFAEAYRLLGLAGCSSSFGTADLYTGSARLVHKAGGSLRDVQLLASHRSIQTTQRYIDGDSDVLRRFGAAMMAGSGVQTNDLLAFALR